MTQNIMNETEVKAAELFNVRAWELVETAHNGVVATRSLLCLFAKVESSEELTVTNLDGIAEKFKIWAFHQKAWVRKCDVDGGGKSEQLAGYKAVIAHGKAKGNDKLVMAGNTAHALGQMASRIIADIKKAEAKKAEEEAKASAENTVENSEETAGNIPEAITYNINDVLMSDLRSFSAWLAANKTKLTKSELIECVDWIAEYIAAIQ